MSIQSARDFLSKVANDEKFRTGFGGCKTQADQEDYVRTAGFSFTRDEMNLVRSEIQDADLDAVSGGCCGCEGSDCGELPH